MPTITIRTHGLSQPQRRAVAVRLTRWLSDQGVPGHQHVVVRFEPTEPGSVFVGGMPAEALDRSVAGAAHASVTCQISGQRGEEFQARLAAEIAAALPGAGQMPFLYLEFRPTGPADVWVGQHGTLWRADGAATQDIPTSRENSDVTAHAVRG